MDLRMLTRFLPLDSTKDKLKSAAKLLGCYIVVKIVAYLRWRRNINLSIPGPPDNLLMGAAMELYNAGLNDFWGFNPRLFNSLFTRYGKMVRFWLPGSGLFVCLSDTDDIAECNTKCVLRPPITEVLLPYLGYDNLLFQKGAMIKNLRLRYGSITQGAETLNLVHQVATQYMDVRTTHWAKTQSVDLHHELDPMVYDLVGEVIFGSTFTSDTQGQALRDEHLYLIKWSSRYGMEVLKSPSWKSLWNSFADMRKFFGSIKKLRGICTNMIEKHRQVVKADPKTWGNDKHALTMLVTNPVSATDSAPFFNNHLATSTCIGFLNGAFDTVHATVFWCFYHLARYRDQQKRLFDEINKACGKKPPTRNELRECKFLDAFLRESMRVRPTVPIGMRVPERDVTIAGVHIPAGTCILPYIAFNHSQEKHFGPEPTKFRPDRFLGDSTAAKTARSKFNGFGEHARMCVGRTFAEAELRAMVTRCVQKFEIHLACPDMPEPDMIYEAGVYQPKEKFHFVFKER